MASPTLSLCSHFYEHESQVGANHIPVVRNRDQLQHLHGIELDCKVVSNSALRHMVELAQSRWTIPIDP